MIEEECMKMLCEGNDFKTELAMNSVWYFAKTNFILIGKEKHIHNMSSTLDYLNKW